MLDAWGWCTGTTQRDGMGREEGGGFRMGNTCFKIIKLKKKKIHIDPEPEKAMTTHSSVLAWKIPWTEELGRLQSMGSLRVRHD